VIDQDALLIAELTRQGPLGLALAGAGWILWTQHKEKTLAYQVKLDEIKADKELLVNLVRHNTEALTANTQAIHHMTELLNRQSAGALKQQG
jgi:hypothetical protein